jgi:hypothetical protein
MHKSNAGRLEARRVMSSEIASNYLRMEVGVPKGETLLEV